MGCSALFSFSIQPMAVPTTSPAIEPAQKPMSTLVKLAKKLSPSTPLAARL